MRRRRRSSGVRVQPGPDGVKLCGVLRIARRRDRAFFSRCQLTLEEEGASTWRAARSSLAAACAWRGCGGQSGILALVGSVSDRKEVLTKPSVSDSSIGWEAGTGEGARKSSQRDQQGPGS